MIDGEGGREEAWVSLLSVGWERADGPPDCDAPERLTLGLQVRWDEGDRAHATVRIDGVRGYKFLDANGGGLQLTADWEHPAIRQHTDPRQSVHFQASATTDPRRLYADLLVTFGDVCEDWCDPTDYFNALLYEEPLDFLSAWGLLFEGPAFLAEPLHRVLQEHEARASSLASGPAVYWDGRHRVEQTEPLQLLHFGSSHVVAERFECTVSRP